MGAYENKGAGRDVRGTAEDSGISLDFTKLDKQQRESPVHGTQNTAWEQLGCNANEIPRCDPVPKRSVQSLSNLPFMDGSCNLQGTNNRGSGAKTASNKHCGLFVRLRSFLSPFSCVNLLSVCQVQVMVRWPLSLQSVDMTKIHFRNCFYTLWNLPPPVFFFSCFFLLWMVDTSPKWYKDIGDTVISFCGNTFFFFF